MRYFLFLAIIIAIIAVFFSLQDKDSQLETITLILKPFFRVGWTTGILPKLMFASYDDSDIKYMKALTKERFQKIRTFQPSKDDVFIVTFPKSGTHLTGHMALQVLHNGTLEFDSFHHVVGVVEIEFPTDCPDKKLVTFDNYKDMILTKPAVLLTHLPLEHMPMHPDAKYIVMMRDPLDTLFSLHTMMKKVVGPNLVPKIHELFSILFRGDSVGYGWAEYNLKWWKKRNEPNVLFLFFEDAIKNLTNTVVDVTRFLGRPIEWGTIEKVRYMSSLEYMKPNANKFEPPNCMNPFGFRKSGKVDMVNKGKSGKSKKYISPDLRIKVKEYYHRVFDNTDFPINRYMQEDQKTG